MLSATMGASRTRLPPIQWRESMSGSHRTASVHAQPGREVSGVGIFCVALVGMFHVLDVAARKLRLVLRPLSQACIAG